MAEPSYFLGTDTGGTKTHALVADQSGNVLGFGAAGPGNHESVGYTGVFSALQESSAQALHQAGLQISQIAGAGFGIAGFDFPSERQPTLETIAQLGLECPFDAANDVTLGLIAGAHAGWGVVVDAGTGNNVRGRDRQGREGWVTGCGSMFGEYGGAGDIVQRALQIVSHHWSRRGRPTALSDVFVQAAGAKDLSDLIEGLALGWYQLEASLVRQIFETANHGDVVAQEILAWAGSELGETTKAVIRQLAIQDDAFDIILIGSVFKGGNLFLEPFKKVITDFATGARFIRLMVPPVAGGVLLGMEQVGLRDEQVRSKLFDSISKFKQP